MTLARAQRVLAAIELFALVLWAGGLFAILAVVAPSVRHVCAEDPQQSWKVMSSIFRRFGQLQPILAAIVLLSNFVKLSTLRTAGELQRIAVLVSAVLLTVSLFSTFNIFPRLMEQWQQVQANPVTSATAAVEQEKFDMRREKYEAFQAAVLLLALFSLYAYRVFEERKIQAILRLFKTPPVE